MTDKLPTSYHLPTIADIVVNRGPKFVPIYTLTHTTS